MTDNLREAIIALIQDEPDLQGVSFVRLEVAERLADRVLTLLAEEALDGNIERDLADRE